MSLRKWLTSLSLIHTIPKAVCVCVCVWRGLKITCAVVVVVLVAVVRVANDLRRGVQTAANLLSIKRCLNLKKPHTLTHTQRDLGPHITIMTNTTDKEMCSHSHCLSFFLFSLRSLLSKKFSALGNFQ